MMYVHLRIKETRQGNAGEASGESGSVPEVRLKREMEPDPRRP